MVLHKQLRVLRRSTKVKVFDSENTLVLSGTASDILSQLQKGSTYRDSFVKEALPSISDDKPLLEVKIKLRGVKEEVLNESKSKDEYSE